MRIQLRVLLMIGILLTSFSLTFSNWWSLALIPPKEFKKGSFSRRYCIKLSGLTRVQKKICLKRPDLMVAVSIGARLAVRSCGRLFASHRWNCSLVRGSSLFGRLLSRSHRESAFLHALFSAGLVHAITKSCSKGSNPHCHQRSSYGLWSSYDPIDYKDDIIHGIRFSRVFLDDLEAINKRGSQRIHMHNIEVGRRAVIRMMRSDCRCHGVSGSCLMQTCSRRLGRFHATALFLKRKYDSALKVRLSRRGLIIRSVLRRDAKKLSKSTLVYLHHSPDYCSPNPKLDILGTAGRSCQLDHVALDSCDVLCCGRGYDTFIRRVNYRCNCKFVWCCSVTCNACRGSIEEYTCKA